MLCLNSVKSVQSHFMYGSSDLPTVLVSKEIDYCYIIVNSHEKKLGMENLTLWFMPTVSILLQSGIVFPLAYKAASVAFFWSITSGGVGGWRRLTELCCKPELIVLPFVSFLWRSQLVFLVGGRCWSPWKVLIPGASCQPAHPSTGDLFPVHGVRKSRLLLWALLNTKSLLCCLQGL